VLHEEAIKAITIARPTCRCICLPLRVAPHFFRPSLKLSHVNELCKRPQRDPTTMSHCPVFRSLAQIRQCMRDPRGDAQTSNHRLVSDEGGRRRSEGSTAQSRCSSAPSRRRRRALTGPTAHQCLLLRAFVALVPEGGDRGSGRVLRRAQETHLRDQGPRDPGLTAGCYGLQRGGEGTAARTLPVRSAVHFKNWAMQRSASSECPLWVESGHKRRDSPALSSPLRRFSLSAHCVIAMIC
jgi:hypothetical protein